MIEINNVDVMVHVWRVLSLSVLLLPCPSSLGEVLLASFHG